MCGIVGMAGVINTKEREVFKDMLIACQVRGRDATGAISVGADNSVGWAKTVGTPDKMFDLKSWDRSVDRFNSKILIGHCRAKTMGENTHKNAHPFDHDNIIGVHNGTLQNWRPKAGSQGFQVDSDFLLSEISEKGIDAVIPTTQGAWALVWWDRTNNSLNFIRNDERPLYFGWSADKKTMFWASESWMIHGVVGRQIKLAALDEGFTTHPLPVNELWSYEVTKLGDFKVVPVRKLEGEKPYVTTYEAMYNNKPYYPRPAQVSHVGGSSVTGPFQGSPPTFLLENMKTETLVDRRLRILRERVNEPLKPLLKPTNEDKITQVTLVGCTTASQIALDLKKPLKTITPFLKNTISRPVLSLINSRLTNRDGRSTAHQKLSVNGQRSLSPLIDTRKVGGVWYITDRKTGKEITEFNFDENTNRTCSWCQSVDNDLHDVYEFVDEWNFICNECNKDTATA